MDKTKLAEAIAALIRCRNFAARVNQIRHGTTALTGSSAVYRVLRELGRVQPEKFDQVVAYCVSKREKPAPDRNEYQKHLMRERRARMAKMLATLEQKHGSPFTKEERQRMELMVSAHWMSRRNAYLQEHGTSNANVARFWAIIDKELGL